jgi:coenzyme F420-0:L-glutamate ligase/coenzyme F420-1:gamma-L-glutamate ligase
MAMSNVLTLIKNRRSIRRFFQRPVPQGTIRKILEGARWAPSAHHAQPWRIVVLEKKEIRNRLAQAMAEALEKDLKEDDFPSEMIKEKIQRSIQRISEAPLSFLVCMSREGLRAYPDARRRRFEEEMALLGIGAAIQNMLLVAHSLGLGGCWLAAPLFCPQTVSRAIEIPRGWISVALILFGYPAERPKGPIRFPIEKIALFL